MNCGVQGLVELKKFNKMFSPFVLNNDYLINLEIHIPNHLIGI